ncbi:hypothetical protein OGAPHI_001575 [Ogataea philodendri]|uniref:SAC domain-containing protein n=2 Tax=Saccharomycotina TaxID=147537 RepID=A0A9P8T8E8_9ASCO|nr:uncharacterized protein OGAPHI_001575 [Ogataea philodendri]KAH3669454.1 hypothetical protein OGAPHI_001575 [Ogataea philodendri]
MSASLFSLVQVADGYLVINSATGGSNSLLVTNTGACELVDAEKHYVDKTPTPISGVIGVIHLHTNHYLIVATGATEVGKVYGNKSVYKVTSFSVLPLSATKFQVDEDEVKYLELLKSHLNSASLVFSYDYDLTKPLTKQADKGFESEFMWNYFVSQDLIKLAASNPGAGQFVLPIIYGYAKFVRTTINMKPITFGLISRRSRFRAGTRYFRRGIDADGNVANFNETEQFLAVHTSEGDKIYTYLQTRGSVPVFWAEMNNLKYKPVLLLGQTDYVPTRHHFSRMIEKYGTNYLVNLVNQKGYEEPVKLAYENAVTALNDPNIKYTYFDFHHECKNMKWHRVKLLIDHLKRIGLSQEDFNVVTVSEKFVVSKKQSHVVRTNCMDCLDRTNVVQSTLGRFYLQEQLIESGVINGAQDWEKVDPKFNLVFMNIWADNADVVSKSYSGTGALKTDFTRTGQRTKLGALNDLVNSITRYIKNNFRDGPRQDGYDLFLGNILPYEIATSPFQDLRPSSTQSIPYILFTSVSILLITFIFPNGSLSSFKNFSFTLVLTALAVNLFTRIVKQGIQYVNWPRLCSLDYLTHREVLNDGKFDGLVFEKADSFNKFQDVAKKE